MRTLITLVLLITIGGIANASWTGAGTYDDPYVYTSNTVNKQYFKTTRGQTLNNVPAYLVDPTHQCIEYRYQQVSRRETFKELVKDMGLMRWKDEGRDQDLEYIAVNLKDTNGNWKKIYEKYKNISKTLIEFQDPTNPPEIIGVNKVASVKSEIHQDPDGDSGDLKVISQIQNANPNPNTDPLADDWQFDFQFSFPNDIWLASILRKVNGVVDINDNDFGAWGMYASTSINLANPTQPLAGGLADWYLDGTNTDNAWTLVNIVHQHPGPVTFSFVPFSDEYLNQNKP